MLIKSLLLSCFWGYLFTILIALQLAKQPQHLQGYCLTISQKTPLFYGLFLGLFGVSLGTLLGYLDNSHSLILMLSLALSLFDCKSHSYPLFIWLIACSILLYLQAFNGLVAVFLLLAVLSSIYPLRIGSGDWLYLAILAFVFNLQQILMVIQLASCLGILTCLLKKRNRLPFIPYLSIAYLLVLLYSLISN